MLFDWDETKAVYNLANHGVAFDDIAQFEWETALVTLDHRFEYGEKLYCAISALTNAALSACAKPTGAR